jgi:hypothetical protein
MGYSHYVSFASNRAMSRRIETKYQTAIRKCAKIVRFVSERDGGLSGYTAHDKKLQYGGLSVRRAGQCESFIMCEHFSENQMFFVNTRQYSPYDTIVVACLIVLKHFLGDSIRVTSDGFWADWADGLDLACKVLKINTLTIPESIRCRL